MQGKGRYWVVPAESHPQLDQGVVLISHSLHQKDAAAFLDFVKTEEVAAVLQRYGFSLPGRTTTTKTRRSRELARRAD